MVIPLTRNLFYEIFLKYAHKEPLKFYQDKI